MKMGLPSGSSSPPPVPPKRRHVVQYMQVSVVLVCFYVFQLNHLISLGKIYTAKPLGEQSLRGIKFSLRYASVLT